MADAPEPVSAVGEFGLIERFRTKLPAAPEGETWSGDDAAVIAPGAPQTLLTIDVLVQGVDFDLSYCSPADIGWKAMAVNVSDIAAMAGRPTRAVAALSLPSHTPVEVVDGILEGMIEAAARWEVDLVGGDISEAPQISIAITLLGEAEAPMLRSGAQVGDAICVTGSLGGAAAGLILLRNGVQRPETHGLRQRQLRPDARVAEGAALAREGGATALIDVSDGFVADLGHVLEASGVGCVLDPTAVPIDPDIHMAGSDVDPLELALTGGEDFELIATLPVDLVDGVSHLVTRVGTVTKSGRSIGGRSLDVWKQRTWEHLRTP